MSNFDIPPKIARERIIMKMRLLDVLPLTIHSKFKRIGTMHQFLTIYIWTKIQSGDLVTIDWNESSLLDQQQNMFQNNIMHGNSHTPASWVCLVFPRHMVYFQEIKQTSHILKFSHGSTMFLHMKNCHKLDKFVYLFFLPSIEHQLCNKIWTLANTSPFISLVLVVIFDIRLTSQNSWMKN